MTNRKISERQRKVYRRRRIVALIILLLVLIGLVWGISAGIRSLNRSREQPKTTSQSSSAAPTPSSAASNKKSEAKDKKAVKDKGKPAVNDEKSSIPNCSSNDTELALSAPEPSTMVGGYIDFTVSIRHEGSDSCLIDASNGSRVLVITSGDQTIWRSDSCPVDNRLLLMAQGDRDEQNIRWEANSTTDQCQSSERLPKVNSGSYKAQLILKSNPKVKSQVVPLLVE
ncbi:hypothetical protein [Bombiscardovia coagulans]|uniref:Uncharacterized protein n=1 Tax=Bombiscardovia coagulans TaxID=686666 RepID=A0A261EUV6_9BIFI|nr:hypothetical protein [Bombiscardovia coagulans]OZG50617.1 hypothetical protein BOCO_0217 [Bombiscardovia coagulans]